MDMKDIGETDVLRMTLDEYTDSYYKSYPNPY